MQSQVKNNEFAIAISNENDKFGQETQSQVKIMNL